MEVKEVKIEMSKEGSGKKYDEWEIKCWADKLIEAKELEADKEKMALVKEYLEKKAKAINSIADLRKAANRQAAESDTADDSDAEETY